MRPDSAEELAQMATRLRGVEPETEEQVEETRDETQPEQQTQEQDAEWVALLLRPKRGDEQLVEALHPNIEEQSE
jgi:hypothetical protein